MTLDEQLLAEAKRTRDEVAIAQEQAELAQVRYQHSIRRLHAAGGSLREIANVLGMSYQRVHQIVDVTAGKGAVRWSSLDSARCSFCGSTEEEAGRLVAGPGPFICGACVTLATELITDGEERAEGPTRLVSVSADRTRCSFCGRKRSRVTGMTEAVGRPPVGRGRRSNGSPAICSDCIALSGELLAQSR
ncbi:ClpX C4-type zinc finger protein [Planomonospora algeriensis]